MTSNTVLFACLVVAFCAVSAFAAIPFLGQKELDRINTAQQGWKAKIPAKFANKTMAELRKFVAAFPPKSQPQRGEVPEDEEDSRRLLATIPASFDARTQWGSCIGPIRDQGECGSCWAFAAAGVFEDRLCIAGKTKSLIQRSTQYMLDCDSQQSGCDGGYPPSVWEFLKTYGTPVESCLPYKGAQGKCTTKCANGATLATRKATSVLSYSSITSVKNDLITRGPVETYMEIYTDFYYYSSGIYQPTTRNMVGYHAVKVIGWGVDSVYGNYWLVQNSWGPEWGENGFFKIKAGLAEFDVIDHFVAGTV